MTVYFDLDGVLRHLTLPVFGQDPETWDHVADDRSLCDIVNDNPEICRIAPPTSYLTVAEQFFDEIHILTHQEDDWKPYTEQWIKKNIIKPVKLIYVDSIEDKLDFLREPTDLFIEDYPKFSSYDQIVLIDRPYNRSADAIIRVNYPMDLRRVLDVHQGMCRSVRFAGVYQYG